MIEKMMDPNIIDYYIIDCAIPSIITIENRYQIDFGKPGNFIVGSAPHIRTVPFLVRYSSGSSSTSVNPFKDMIERLCIVKFELSELNSIYKYI